MSNRHSPPSKPRAWSATTINGVRTHSIRNFGRIVCPICGLETNAYNDHQETCGRHKCSNENSKRKRIARGHCLYHARDRAPGNNWLCEQCVVSVKLRKQRLIERHSSRGLCKKMCGRPLSFRSTGRCDVCLEREYERKKIQRFKNKSSEKQFWIILRHIYLNGVQEERKLSDE